MKDPYLYPGTNVLRNLAGIKTENEFNDMEADYTCYRLSQLVIQNVSNTFQYIDFCYIHHFIFQDIFEWAGKIRVINIEKSEPALSGISIEYSDYKNIKEEINGILTQINICPWKELKQDVLVKTYSAFFAQLWKTHPFREGNTRTVVAFCCRFIEDKGIYIDSELFKEHAVYMRTALVAASAIFSDLGDRRKPEYLERIIGDALENGNRMKKKIVRELDLVGIRPDEDIIKKIVDWNRKEGKMHNGNEISRYLRNDF